MSQQQPNQKILPRNELIKRLERFRGPYLGDGVNPGIDVPSLLAALQPDLKALQRYDYGMHAASWNPAMGTYDDGEYVRYEDVVKLLAG